MTSYPASSTAFLSSILLNSRSYEIIASLSFKDTFAEAHATLLIAFVTLLTQCSQVIPLIFIVFVPITGPSKCFSFTFFTTARTFPMHMFLCLFDRKNCDNNKDEYNNNICHFMIPLFTLHYLFSNLRISL